MHRSIPGLSIAQTSAGLGQTRLTHDYLRRGVSVAIAIDVFVLWSGHRPEADEDLDAPPMAQQGASGGIEVSPEAGAVRGF
jgi:hypothetical protein